MTQDEKDSMYIANCKACTLAERMKDCKACLFKDALIIKALGSLGKLPVDERGRILINP